MMELQIKGCGVKALPHVRSWLTHFKKKFGAMQMMRSESGFGWNEAKQYFEVDDDVFKEYVKVTQSHPSCAKMNNNPFPRYNDLLFIF
ncbi:hypothetical protein LINPERPRIM_LOCUS5852 [Linum perenne]